MRTNFEPGRSFANELDFQLQLDAWCDRVNARVLRTTRAVVAERLAEERERMRPLPARLPDADRRFANALDFQDQFDGWCERINARVHRTTRAVVAERLAEERERMRALPALWPDTDRRFVMRVPAQPYLRFDRNDYSLDPRLVGRRVEVRASQAQITAVCLDTGEVAARHVRVFAGGLCFTDPAHQLALDELRGERRRRRTEPDVELRPLARYDQLIPA